MKYLFHNTKNSFTDHIPGGAAIWHRLISSATIILTTPNGWDFMQQDVLREAAVMAGLVRQDQKYNLLEFVTEGEASVHWALEYNPAAQNGGWLSPQAIFAVVDAGGSTVDSSVYQCERTHPTIALQEVCPSACVQVREFNRILPFRITFIGGKRIH